MRIRLLATAAVATVVGLAVGAGVGTADPPENAAMYWARVAEPAVSTGRPPASGQVLAGIVHAAIYDAVAATAGGLEPFMASPSVAQGASPDAAVAKAARDVLVTRVPAQAAAVDAAYASFIGGIPGSQAKTDGIAAGAAVAAQILALRANDGFDNVVPFVQPPTGPGVFEPFSLPPVDVKLQQVTPYTYDSPSDFDPGPPVSLKSGEYAASLEEVKAYGGTNADTLRTQAQTDTARFYTENPYVQYSRMLRWLAGTEQLDLRDTARLFALVHVGAADTQIACWWAKYHYNFWRPTHAIQRADTDGNHKTQPASWTHLVTGNHPEYPSGHGCETGALTEALQRFFHTDRVYLEIESAIFPAPDPRHTRSYDRLGDLYDEVIDARIWGGLHFRSTMEETYKLPNRVVAHVAAHHFRETRGKD